MLPFFSLLGMTVVLRYPYNRNVNEPHSYTDITRHAECGKDSKYAQDEKPPDFSVCYFSFNNLYLITCRC